MTETLNKILDEQSADIQPDMPPKTPNYVLRRIATVSGLALAMAGGTAAYKGGEHLVDRIKTPIEYSEETTTYTVQENEGLDAITSNVAGINNVDFTLVKEHIRTMPENIEPLSDKVIQLGETYIIPAEVKKR